MPQRPCTAKSITAAITGSPVDTCTNTGSSNSCSIESTHMKNSHDSAQLVPQEQKQPDVGWQVPPPAAWQTLQPAAGSRQRTLFIAGSSSSRQTGRQYCHYHNKNNSNNNMQWSHQHQQLQLQLQHRRHYCKQPSLLQAYGAVAVEVSGADVKHDSDTGGCGSDDDSGDGSVTGT